MKGREKKKGSPNLKKNYVIFLNIKTITVKPALASGGQNWKCICTDELNEWLIHINNYSEKPVASLWENTPF